MKELKVKQIVLNKKPLSGGGDGLYYNGTRLLYDGEGGSGSGVVSDGTYVRTTGDQTILGAKSFIDPLSAGTIEVTTINSAGSSDAAIFLDEVKIKDGGGFLSIDWGNKTLNTTASETTSLNWSSFNLYGAWSVDNYYPNQPEHIVNKSYLDSITGSFGFPNFAHIVMTSGDQNISGVKVFINDVTGSDFFLSNIKSPTDGSNSIAITSRELYASDGSTAMGWGGRVLQDSYNNQSVNWGGRYLANSSTDSVLDWETYSLLDASLSESLNWNTHSLVGNWSTSAVPTDSGHLVNKGFMEAAIVASVSRNIVTYTTPSLAVDATDSTNFINAGKSSFLVKLETDVPAWVRIYSTEDARTNDAARLISEDPPAGEGVLVDFITATGDLEIYLGPQIPLCSAESPAVSNLPISITNKNSVTGTVTLSLTRILIES